MSKLKLVICDADEAYLDRLSSYILTNHSIRLEVYFFTKVHIMTEYLSDSSNRADILLINPTMCKDNTDTYNARLVIYLLQDKAKDFNGSTAIYKFQHADKLLTEALSIYSGLYTNEFYVPRDKRQTKVIAIYSPEGGAGKTSVALSAAMTLQRQGCAVFFLSLEGISSLSGLLGEGNGLSLTRVFFMVREKVRNLGLRLDEATSQDAGYGFHYFKPFDSSLEIAELDPEDPIMLLGQLKRLGKYDVLLVDMDSRLDTIALAILEESDGIILVTGEGITSGDRISAFKRDLELHSGNDKKYILNKAACIINKCSKASLGAGHTDYGCGLGQECIPEILSGNVQGVKAIAENEVFYPVVARSISTIFKGADF